MVTRKRPFTKGTSRNRIGGKESRFLGDDEIYDAEEITNKREIGNE